MTEDIFQVMRTGTKENLLSLLGQVEINITNELGQNLLHEAILYKPEMVDFLLGEEINPNQKDNKGQTPLHYCAMKNLDVLASKILNAGGDLSISDNYGNEPLWVAVFNARGKYATVKLFINSGADINHKNNNKKSPYDFANQIEDKELCSILKH